MERSGVGGQAGVTKRIYNYPSFHEGIEKLKPRSVFIFIDLGPNTEFVEEIVDRNHWGFIVTDKAPVLDRVYTVFGHVVDGIEVVERIEMTPTDGETPLNRVELIRVRLERMGSF